jgi:hypothetical protein
MNQSHPFFQEVVATCADIEAWFSGRAAPAALAGLMARFSPPFSMVTLQGARIDLATLQAMFAQSHGKRPGLHIEIDELEEIHAGSEGAIVTYRERQSDGAGNDSVRRSTAVFERDASGRIVWRHLHETPVAAA